MSENTEIKDLVDLDDDNYTEIVDLDVDNYTEIKDLVVLDDDSYTEEADDIEEPKEDEGAGEGGEKNGEEALEDTTSDDGRKEHSLGNYLNDNSTKHVEDEENSVQDDGNAKYLDLLALPPHGSEVFIKGLPWDVSEDDLIKLCEPFGDIFEIRVMKNKDTGESKGFAFVAFKTKDEAQKTIGKLCNKEFKGQKLHCSLSEIKYGLCIKNVPKGWTDDEFRKFIEATGPGAETIELFKDPQNPNHNRGTAFVGYYNNACALYSRQKISAVNFKWDCNTAIATCADPKIAPDHFAAAQESLIAGALKLLNEGSMEDLKRLWGIGEQKKKIIMELRSENSSPFKTLDDLQELDMSKKQIQRMMNSLSGELFNNWQC